jgi:electron transfer flavoprotein alpha subunit
VFSISDDRNSAYGAERWLATLPSLLGDYGPSHILMGHTSLGAELGPRLAFRLGSTVATGCERLELKQGKLSVLRPCFGNKARETLTLEKCPAVATVRARHERSAAADGAGHEGDRRSSTDRFGDRHHRHPAELEAEDAGARLESAKIVIAGGRGLEARGLSGSGKTCRGARGRGRRKPRRVRPGLGAAFPADRLVGQNGQPRPVRRRRDFRCEPAHGRLRQGESDPRDQLGSRSSHLQDSTFGVVGDYKEIVPALIEAIGRLK